ncbi:MAG TPA: bifunctional phosphopantothenoylcysteine decarboxylase/phosphopantothenate--cysteine ligase CoaBC [Propionibacteriaceae bacterium]|nr:bifunctional phosphopantothenoylcysteine decarboxylase/phosphopantothenate--cysteine ligase CoaBC [Propionibacteriaceae bacterium]
MSRVVLGVTGGIAAYKACEIVRRLRDAGHDVTVVPTPNALEFVGEVTWAALSGNPVATDVFTSADQIPHVRIGRSADLVLVAPATADLLARAVAGRADDLLTNVLLTATCPVIVCPAMHTEMWQHPATQHNVATLRSRGVIVLDPATGRLAGPDVGQGRLPEPSEIVEAALLVLEGSDVASTIGSQDLAGVRLAVSAGGTREQIDPVRFIGNASSGRMGVALARAAALRGADVTLVAAHIEGDTDVSDVTVRQVRTTADLAQAMQEVAADHDVLVMAAAPADFTPVTTSETKIKKADDSGITVELEQTVDVLATLTRNRREGQTIVGFAAETISNVSELLTAGRAKLSRKGCDVLVVNDVSGGKVFGSETTTVHILDTRGLIASVTATKMLAAHRILDAVIIQRQSEGS